MGSPADPEVEFQAGGLPGGGGALPPWVGAPLVWLVPGHPPLQKHQKFWKVGEGC